MLKGTCTQVKGHCFNFFLSKEKNHIFESHRTKNHEMYTKHMNWNNHYT